MPELLKKNIAEERKEFLKKKKELELEKEKKAKEEEKKKLLSPLIGRVYE